MQSPDIPGSGFEAVVAQVERGETPALSDNPTLDALADRLRFVNFRQWQLEDEVRKPGLTPDERLRVVRAIQLSNSERSTLIERIDRLYLESVAASKPLDASDHTDIPLVYHETLGQILDILIILEVRRYHIVEAKNRAEAPPPGYAWEVAVQAIDAQIALCARSYSTLYELYGNGKAQLPPYAKFKMYGGSFG